MRILAVFFILICPLMTLGQSHRLALVIGNERYPHNELRNPRKDASSVAEALRSLNYKVTLGLDLQRDDFLEMVDRFDRSIRMGDVVIFYYAGHGLQVNGENYLVPTDFAKNTESEMKAQLIGLSDVLQSFVQHGSGTQVIILDACRNNPFQPDRSLKGGWAGTGSSAGTFLAFGTAPGSTAADGAQDAHGLFTSKLLPYLHGSDLDIEATFQNVRYDVIRESHGEQVPWVASSLIGSLHIDPANDRGRIVPSTEDDDHTATGESAITAPRSLSPRHRDLGYQTNKSESDECGTTFSSSGLSTVRDQLENAIVAASRGDYACGERAINVVLGSNPMSAVALRILGIILQLKGEPSRAMTYFARARQVDPTNRLISYYECLASQETPEAVPNCARAVKENDGLPEAHIMLANALLTQAPNEALKEADRAISIKPSGFASLLRAKALAALEH